MKHNTWRQGVLQDWFKPSSPRRWAEAETAIQPLPMVTTTLRQEGRDVWDLMEKACVRGCAAL